MQTQTLCIKVGRITNPSTALALSPHIKGQLLPALAMNVGIERKWWSAELYNMNVRILRWVLRPWKLSSIIFLLWIMGSYMSYNILFCQGLEQFWLFHMNFSFYPFSSQWFEGGWAQVGKGDVTYYNIWIKIGRLSWGCLLMLPARSIKCDPTTRTRFWRSRLAELSRVKLSINNN